VGVGSPLLTFELPPDVALAVLASCGIGRELRTLDNCHTVGDPTNGLRFAAITMPLD